VATTALPGVAPFLPGVATALASATAFLAGMAAAFFLCEFHHDGDLGRRSVWRASGADESRGTQATVMAAAGTEYPGARTLGCQLELETEAKD
uniref:Uncharacterized protein n=1 Tax=Suricata suricatta TaxID=37032 RepID=A0A673SWL3_SURSU